MDFGAMSFDNFLCSNTSNNGGFALENGTSAENNKQQKWYAGSGFLKQERAINQDDSNNLREFKVAKTTGNSCGEAMLKIPLQRSNCSNNLSVDGQQMLSFSSNPTLPYYHQTNSTAFSRNSGYINGGGMQGVLSGVRGPFTPSQWMELEHQALIYKYITANVPIPSYLLNPIRKAFESAGFPTFSGLRSNPLVGWGGFHLGLSNSDPEPGRCRRTDGKKWRCSRDAVADQKYCERHMNRGRHRSRKPVEGQTQSQSNAASAGIAANPNNNAKLSSSTPSTSVAAGGVSNGLTLSHHHQLTNAQPPTSAALPNINRSVLEKQNPNAAYLKHQSAYEESSSSSFGLVCSDSLLNPLNKSSSLVNKSHSLRQFMDNWPKNQSESAAWPDADQSDRTQLSISIPIASSPPPNETSPLRLPREQLEMGLGVGMTMTTVSDDHQTPRHSANWVPISWEPSMGGPLGEVLHTGDCKNAAKPLNLIDSWDNSPRLASSPTGVLQRGAFTSLSNSSAGSSPRAESNALMIGPGSGLMNPSLPAL